MTLRAALIRLLGGTPGDGDGQARPSAQMSEAFGRMLDDLRISGAMGDVVPVVVDHHAMPP